MANEIIHTDIEGVSFERGNGKFAAVFPDGSCVNFDIESLNAEINTSELVLDELNEGLAELLRGPEPITAGIGDEFIEFNDDARDALMDGIVDEIDRVIERALGKNLDSSFVAGDLIDAVADVVEGFGR